MKKLVGLCAAAIAFTVPATLRAQLADIPIKPGLWETEVIVSIRPTPVKAQACFTAGTTLRDYITAVGKGSPGLTCTVTKGPATAHSLVFDYACKDANMTSNTHADFQSLDLEHFSGSSHATVTGSMQGKPINMTLDKTFTGKFLGADCGTVKPVVVPGSGK